MYTVNSSEQLRELSCNDLSFLENDQASAEAENGAVEANSTVRDLDNILDKFEADTQILLDNPNQLLNCKYRTGSLFYFASLGTFSILFSLFSGSQKWEKLKKWGRELASSNQAPSSTALASWCR